MALFRNTTEGDAAAAPPPQRLGELLVSSQLLTPEQLAEAEAEAERSGTFLSKVMVQKGLITQDDINACFVKRCKIPHISLLDYEISTDVLKLIPREVCEKYGLLPIDKLGRILTVAMVDPLDSEALDIIRDHCAELRLKPILCNWAHFEQVAGKYFAEGGAAAKGNDVTMESFGLAKLQPKSVAPPQPPAPKPAPATGAPPAAPGIDSAALVQAIQDGMRGVAQDIIGAVRGMQAPPSGAASTAPAAPGIDSAALVQAIHDGMRGVSQDLLSAFQGMHAPAPAGPNPPDLASALRDSLADIVREMAAARQDSPAQSENIASQVRDAVSTAMSEAIQPLMSRPAPEPAQAAAPELDTGALAEVLRDAVGGVLEEAMASLAVQIRASAGHSESEAAAQQALVAELRSAQDAAASALQEVINSALAAQALQGARLAELAEAAVLSSQQTTQLVEASLVQAGGARARHSSVAAFGPASDDGSHAAEDERVREALEAEIPLETFTLDNYIAGKANAFTLKVSQAVAQKPGGEYNPFFLYGNVGLGKTHLISAVGNQIQREQPGQRVGYVSASHFSRRLKDALAANAQDAFRDNYCHWDVLILDDIQFLGGRVEAQEEFFHIFNVLHQQGRQIIIASDKAPDRLGLLEQRLISRFSSGIVVEIKPPEWETRMQILRSHAGPVAPPEEILSLIAMRVPGDVRKMVGCLRKVLAFAAHSEGPMTVELATEILSHLGGEAAA